MIYEALYSKYFVCIVSHQMQNPYAFCMNVNLFNSEFELFHL
jgi:hypothetical protein